MRGSHDDENEVVLACNAWRRGKYFWTVMSCNMRGIAKMNVVYRVKYFWTVTPYNLGDISRL